MYYSRIKGGKNKTLRDDLCDSQISKDPQTITYIIIAISISGIKC